MAIFFAMPKLGMNMTEGHITSWLVKEGMVVKAGQPILEIETDKATNEVESPAGGIIARILYPEGADVPCNSVLAVILAEDEALPESIPTMIGEEVAPKAEMAAKPQGAASASASGSPTSTSDRRVSISPSARKLAQELGVDTTKITPAGSQIKREDIQRAFESQSHLSAKPTEVVKKPLNGIRRVTAERMAQSVHTTARVALNIETNAENLIRYRALLEADGVGKVSYNLLVAKQAAQALHEFPYMNSRIVGDEIWEMGQIHIGIAVDTGQGLLVPVIKEVDRRSIQELHADFQALVERAATGHSTPEDLSGGTFTITNLGAFEIESFTPVINLPECAILAVGAILPKAVAIDGRVTVANMVTLTLTFDHRIVDGAPAARFLQRIKQLIEGIG